MGETPIAICRARHGADRSRKKQTHWKFVSFVGRPPAGGAKKERKSRSASTPSMISKSKVWLQWISEPMSSLPQSRDAARGDQSRSCRLAREARKRSRGAQTSPRVDVPLLSFSDISSYRRRRKQVDDMAMAVSVIAIRLVAPRTRPHRLSNLHRYVF